MTELLAGCDHFIAGAAMIGGISYFHTYAYDLLATNERIIAASCDANTRDFRCLWRSGLLPLSCSVSVFESGCVVPPRECGRGFGPRVAAGTARGSTVRGPGGRGGFSFLTVPASAAVMRSRARIR
jgi:hypothetical protein